MRLGLDVGGSSIKAVALESEVEDLGTWSVPASARAEFLLELVDELIGAHAPESLGVGVAGLVKWPDGEFVWGPHLGQMQLSRSELAHRYSMPVAVDNDANMAALAEAGRGAGAGFGTVLVVTLGRGIGAGIVEGGAVRHGRSFAGEAGHIAMVDGGQPCVCGRLGCWETTVSAVRMDEIAAKLGARTGEGLPVVSGAEWLRREADSGNLDARAALADLGGWLGRGLTDLILVLDPDVVVIGGAGAVADRWLLEPAHRSIVSQLPGSPTRQAPPLVVSHFGRLAGAVGAAIASGQ